MHCPQWGFSAYLRLSKIAYFEFLSFDEVYQQSKNAASFGLHKKILQRREIIIIYSYRERSHIFVTISRGHE
jgi:hypothetical protein